MTGNHVTESLRRLFLETLNTEVRSDDTDLIETGLIDSLALVQLLFEIEREFNVSLPLDELEVDSFRTVRSIGAYVTSQVPS